MTTAQEAFEKWAADYGEQYASEGEEIFLAGHASRDEEVAELKVEPRITDIVQRAKLDEQQARIEQLEGAVRYLFQLIDDIDTASDIAKHDDKLYRALVETIQAKRWSTGITTDGYTLNLEALNAGRKEHDR